MPTIAHPSDRACTGCGACQALCPVGAVTCRINGDGFLQARIDEKACVGCGRCGQACPRYAGEDEGAALREGTLYAAVSASAAAVASCTSGGVAYELARWGIDNGFRVAGVVYDREEGMARTVLANTHEDLEPMKGSKYLQAESGRCFGDMAELAARDPSAKFLVFGTPCQIAGISKSFEVLGFADRLLTADLFCHGVPSRHLWTAYRRWLREGQRIDAISWVRFRSKHGGWHDFTMEIGWQGGTYRRCGERDPFYRAFFDNMLLGDACRDCVFRKARSAADIRLGDFWGKHYRDDQAGVSAVLVLTQRGREVLEAMRDRGQVRIVAAHSTQDALSAQSLHDYRYDGPVRAAALEQLRQGRPLPQVIRRYRKGLPLRRRVKIRIREGAALLPHCWRRRIKRAWHRSR